MERVLVPELLDELPDEDPRAIRSRADLKRINWLMGQAPIMAGLIARHAAAPGATSLDLLEIGAGDGSQTLRVVRRLARHGLTGRVALLDMADTVSPARVDAFAALGWEARVETADAFEWLASTPQRFDAVLANLFLHHFEGEALLRLLRLVAARARVFVATEPRRDRPSLLAAHATVLIGANDVTRHDAPASVRAGFAGDELAHAWREAGGGAVYVEGRRGPFTHAFVASGADEASS